MEIPAARSALGNAIAGNSICPGNENIEDSRGWSRASPHRELGPAISRFHATVEPTPRVCRALGHVLASAGYVIVDEAVEDGSIGNRGPTGFR